MIIDCSDNGVKDQGFVRICEGHDAFGAGIVDCADIYVALQYVQGSSYNGMADICEGLCTISCTAICKRRCTLACADVAILYCLLCRPALLQTPDVLIATPSRALAHVKANVCACFVRSCIAWLTMPRVGSPS